MPTSAMASQSALSVGWCTEFWRVTSQRAGWCRGGLTTPSGWRVTLTASELLSSNTRSRMVFSRYVFSSLYVCVHSTVTVLWPCLSGCCASMYWFVFHVEFTFGFPRSNTSPRISSYQWEHLPAPWKYYIPPLFFHDLSLLWCGTYTTWHNYYRTWWYWQFKKYNYYDNLIYGKAVLMHSALQQ